jgi:hypothetical protein
MIYLHDVTMYRTLRSEQLDDCELLASEVLIFSSHSHDIGRFGTITFEAKTSQKCTHIFDTGQKKVYCTTVKIIIRPKMKHNLNQRRWLAGPSPNHNIMVLRLPAYPDSPPRFSSDRVQYAAGTSAVRLPKHHFPAGCAGRATMMNDVTV